jgi:hypothetical protein
VIWVEPITLGVKPREHVPPLSSVQLPEAAKLPEPVGAALQEMVPEGVPTVPTGLVSITVAAHVVGTARSTGFGVHTTVVPVIRWTVSVVVSAAPVCVASPP